MHMRACRRERMSREVAGVLTAIDLSCAGASEEEGDQHHRCCARSGCHGGGHGNVRYRNCWQDSSGQGACYWEERVVGERRMKIELCGSGRAAGDCV